MPIGLLPGYISMNYNVLFPFLYSSKNLLWSSVIFWYHSSKYFKYLLCTLYLHSFQRYSLNKSFCPWVFHNYSLLNLSRVPDSNRCTWFCRPMPKPLGQPDIMWCGAELNCRHMDFQSIALPTELPHHIFKDLVYYRIFF